MKTDYSVLSKITDETLLDKLLESVNYKVRLAVAANPHCSRLSLQALLDDDLIVLRSLATNPSLDLFMMEELLKQQDWEIDRALAVHPKARGKILRVLSQSAQYFIRRLVASHPNATEEVLRDLLEDNNPLVSKTAALKLKEIKGEGAETDGK